VPAGGHAFGDPLREDEGKERLKQLVAELSLTDPTLKKVGTGMRRAATLQAIGSGAKGEVIDLVRRSPPAKRTGIERVPMEDRARFLSDRESDDST
jgi:hypothetical protein